jgi:hypothetical protein
MKIHFRTPALVFSIGALLLTVASAALAEGHGRRCSNQSVAGSFGYISTGLRGTTAVAGAGLIRFNWDGTATGEQTLSFGGTIAHETYSGTFQVGDNCRGNFTVVVTSDVPPLNGRTSTVDLVWEDNSNAAHAIFTVNGTVLTADARRIFSSQN